MGGVGVDVDVDVDVGGIGDCVIVGCGVAVGG